MAEKYRLYGLDSFNFGPSASPPRPELWPVRRRLLRAAQRPFQRRLRRPCRRRLRRLKDSVAQRPNHSNLCKSENSVKILSEFRKNSQNFSEILKDLRLFNIFYTVRRNSDTKSSKSIQNSMKIVEKKCGFCKIRTKIRRV